MADYLLDTSILSALMRDNSLVLARIANLGATDRLITCSIARGEIRYGLERMPQGKRRTEFEVKAAAVLQGLESVPITDAIAEQYGQLKRSVETAGTPLNDNDLWIAATAIAAAAVLVTADSDFRRIPGLEVEDWTAPAP